MFGRIFRLVVLFLTVSTSVPAARAQAAVRAWGEFVEPNFPFVAATVDARQMAGGSIEDNLIVRGVIVFLGDGTYACYDTDLVRLGAVWKGGFLDYKSMASHSYYNQGKKNQGGQVWVSQPQGECVTATGLYPGVHGAEVIVTDDRPAPPDSREIGRGPIEPEKGAWKGVHVVGDRAVLRYSVQGHEVREMLASAPISEGAGYIRMLSVAPRADVVNLILSDSMGLVLRSANPREVTSANPAHAFSVSLSDQGPASLVVDEAGRVVLRVAPSVRQEQIEVLVLRGASEASDSVWGRLAPESLTMPNPVREARRLWTDVVHTRGQLGRKEAGQGFVIDEITLPEVNPWRRQLRVADLVFLEDQSAAVVTFDGDVWHLSGLSDSLDGLTWRRIASGLHEPQSINVRDGELFVYTRNGLIRLNDFNGDGEIDYYETFSNRFTQTAETREFPNDSVVLKDGSFLLAKPGQQGAHQGIHNGSILRVTPDGRDVHTLATGFRQPYLGYREKDGLITASDQQGHWVPTTPIHWIREGRHYGFRPSTEVIPPSLPITAPISWIPHRVVQSATSQVWVDSDKMGPLSGRLVCLDYYRANLMLVHIDDEASPVQGAASALSLPVDLPVLKGDMNPDDGWLYLSGFQIWGSKAKPWSGIRRVRYVGGGVSFPLGVRSVKEGLLLQFEEPLNVETATDLGNYHVGRWNYQRTKNYGSGHYKLDGEPGSDLVGVTDVLLSSDHRSALIVIPDMRPVMQMEVVYRIKTAEGQSLEGAAYATVHELQEYGLVEAGFSPSAISAALEKEALQTASQAEDHLVSEATGQMLYQAMGCMACHSLDGSTAGRSGPTLRGVYGQLREFSKGAPRRADERYLRDSILDPPKNVVKAFATSDIGMPSYQGILTPAQIESLLLFIKSLE